MVYRRQLAAWIVLRVKVMSRAARFAPLSATTPVGWLPPVAQITLSRTWRSSSRWAGGVESGRSAGCP